MEATTCTRRNAAVRRYSPLVLATLLACTGSAWSQTWSGLGGSNNWSDRLNWAGGVAPVSSASTAIAFASAPRTTPIQNIASVFDLHSLTFATSAVPFALAGNTLRFNGAAQLVQNSSPAMVVGNNLQIMDSLTYSGGGSMTLAGQLTSGIANAAFRPTFVKRGSGTLTLAAVTGFNGSVSIEQGRVLLREGLALQSADVAIGTAGGLDFGSLTNASIGGLSGSGALALGTGQLTVGGSGRTPGAYTGDITATTGSITKVGAGTLELGGTSAIDRLRVERGGLLLNGGEVRLSRIGESLVVGTRSATTDAGPALTLQGGARLIQASSGLADNELYVDGGPGTTLRLQGSGTRLDTGYWVYVGQVAQGRVEVGSGATFGGYNQLIVGYAAGSRGEVAVTAGGTLNTAAGIIGGVAGGASGSVTVLGSGATWKSRSILIGGYDPEFGGGAGSITVADGGLIQIQDNLTFMAPGSARVDGGRLEVGWLGGENVPGGTLLLQRDPAGGSALTIAGGYANSTFIGSITGAGSVQMNGPGLQALAGTNSFTGRVQVSGGTLVMSNSQASEYRVDNGAQLTLGEGTLGSAVVEAQAGGRVVYTASSLSGGLLAGPGTHDISAVQRLVGSGVANGAVLAPATGTTFAGVANAGSVVVGAGRTLAWSNGSNSVGTLAVSGTVNLSAFSSGGVLGIVPGGLVQNSGTHLLLAGGSRTTIGSVAAPGGTLRMLNATQVQLNGGLLVNNGTLDGTLVVNYGGLAKGSGVFGNVQVTDGGRFSPGNSPGTARTGSSSWGAGGGYVVELSSATGTAGADWDLWAIDGALDISAGSTANSRFTISVLTLDGNDQAAALAGFDPQAAWRWQIVRAGAINGFDSAVLALDTGGFANATAGGGFALERNGGDVYLVFAPVPEPATLALMLAGVAGILARRRWATR